MVVMEKRSNLRGVDERAIPYCEYVVMAKLTDATSESSSASETLSLEATIAVFKPFCARLGGGGFGG